MTAKLRFDCQEAFRRLDDFLDRELSPEETAAVREHLEDCLRCAREFEFEGAWIERMKDKFKRIDVSDEFRARLLRALHDDTTGE